MEILFSNGVSIDHVAALMRGGIGTYNKAIVTCDISHVGDCGVCYPNEKILVLLSSDLKVQCFIGCGFYTICNDPNDFMNNIVVGQEGAVGYYVSNFKKLELVDYCNLYLFKLVNLSASDAEVNGEGSEKLFKSHEKAVAYLDECLMIEKREYETNNRGCTADIERVSDEFAYLWFNAPYEGIVFEVKSITPED